MKSFQPLIYAVDAENITIKGEGTLDGQGKKWWMEFFRVMIDLKIMVCVILINISRCGMLRMIRLPSMQRRIKIMSALCSVVFPPSVHSACSLQEGED